MNIEYPLDLHEAETMISESNYDTINSSLSELKYKWILTLHIMLTHKQLFHEAIITQCINLLTWELDLMSINTIVYNLPPLIADSANTVHQLACILYYM